jgi:hypothetical protein
MATTVHMNPSVWQHLPDDLVWVIRGQRTQLRLDEHPDLLMTHKYGACYCCGGWADIQGHSYYDDLSYTFCGTCDEREGLKYMDIETRVMYCNTWGGNDSERWQRMYHTAIAPEVDDRTWDVFWEDRFEGLAPTEVRRRFDIWEEGRIHEAVQRYQDDWLGLGGNGLAFDWGESDDEIES